MNERIKELAAQAERLAKDELAHLERVHNRLYSPTEDREIYNQKFAELIVRECIQVVDGMADPEEDSDRYVWALHNAIEKIREHFGVQE